MTDKEIKECAHDKVYSIYLNIMRESLQLDKYWKVDPDRAVSLEKAHDKEVQIYSYILSLIEKDNRL
jgi:hypothetical protein